jgi:hypothetical protein
MKKTNLLSVIFIIFFFTLPKVLSACTDMDADGYGVCPNCNITNGCASNGNDCNDADANINPGRPEATGVPGTCSDGKDNDCNNCVDASDYKCGGIETSCTDHIDNDCDGLIDCNDADCNSNLACLPKIFYTIIGLGSGNGQSSSYKLKFAMPDQPVGIYQSSDYKLYLGHYYLIYRPSQPVNPPVITIYSPNSSIIYYKYNVLLNFTITNSTPISWIGYSLNRTANKTIPGPINMTGLADRWNNITVFANDSAGNMGVSEIRQFFYCFGDITGPGGVQDKKVDARDVSLVSSLFGAKCGDGRYDARADLNDDCKIDARDVSPVSASFGKKCL